jgi:hypothetical protein
LEATTWSFRIKIGLQYNVSSLNRMIDCERIYEVLEDMLKTCAIDFGGS